MQALLELLNHKSFSLANWIDAFGFLNMFQKVAPSFLTGIPGAEASVSGMAAANLC